MSPAEKGLRLAVEILDSFIGVCTYTMRCLSLGYVSVPAWRRSIVTVYYMSGTSSSCFLCFDKANLVVSRKRGRLGPVQCAQHISVGHDSPLQTKVQRHADGRYFFASLICVTAIASHNNFR